MTSGQPLVFLLAWLSRVGVFYLWNTIVLRRPTTQINHLAALGTEWTKKVVRDVRSRRTTMWAVDQFVLC